MPTITIGGISSSYNTAGNDYYDVPTNPKLTLGGYQTGDKLFTIIYEDGSISNDTIERAVSSGTIHTQYSNLHNTNGFSIRCFDNATNTGVDLSSINLANNEYYVMINSDNTNLYHFAKITSVGNADVQGDKFEFSPKLGNEIAKGVKFRVFKGPSNTNKIIAVSAGIDEDISLLNIARPYFYFYNDKLDKKNELNHNTKYMLKNNDTKSPFKTSVTIDNVNHAFTTVADHRYKIIDYSKFTYNIKLEDKLKLLDDPNDATSNESTLLSTTYATTTNYNNSFINARRDVNDDASSLDLTGPKRYIYYNFSPEDNNRMPNVYECNIADSFDAKAGYASLKLIDSTKNLSNKVFNNDRLFVNQKLSEENLNDWVEVGEIESNIGLLYTLRGEVERPNLYFSAGNEILIGNMICIVDSVSGNTNQITLNTTSQSHPRGRLETDSEFTDRYWLVFAEGTKVYRRRLNPVDNTFMTATNISENKLEKLNAIILSNEYQNFYCRLGSFISNVDEDYGLLTLTFENNLMDSETALRYVFGEFLLNYQVFFGEVEEINKSLENQQSVFEIQGRNTLSKLVDIILNKNTAFSEDIIYSSFSPYNKLTTVYAGNGSSNPNEVEVFDNTVQFGIAEGTFASMPVVGDLLFSVNGYIGRVTTVGTYSGSLVEVGITRAITRVAAGETIYKQNEKNYMFTKALGSSHIASISPTSLVGSAEKGLIFTAGNMNLGLPYGAAEGDSLVGTSSFGSFALSGLETGTYSSSNQDAIGYQINEPSGIANDNSFQCKLKNEIGNKEESLFDTVDTLIDFEVVSTSKKDNITEIELAPYIPLTLGRKIKYEGINAERMETTYTQAAVVTVNENAREVVFITTSLSGVNIGDPLYCESFDNSVSETKGFIGYVLDIFQTDRAANFESSGNPATNTSTFRVQLDRTETSAGNVLHFDVGDIIYLSNRKRHHINTLNSAHLWGGKMITIPHHTFLADNSNRTVPFNMHLGSSDMNKEFGMPIYKSFNSDIKRLGEETFTFNAPPLITAGFFSVRKTPFVSNFTSYQFKPNVNSGLNNVIEEGKTDSNRKIPYDMRGMNSAYGSNITHQRRMKRDNIESIVPSLIRGILPSYTMAFENKDHSFPRLFFYMTCDILPYSDNRPSSIFSNLKNINNYKLFLLENTKKTSGTDLILQDNNFQTLSFTTDITLNNLKRFGLIRLTECVYDENFNLFNPEKSTNEIYAENETPIANQFHERVSLTGNTITAINYAANTITFQNSLTLSQGDEIFTSDGKFICRLHTSFGPEVGGGTTGTVFTTTTAGTWTPDFSTTHSNPIRITRGFTTYIKGRHKSDSVLGNATGLSNSVKYHPLKGAIIPKSSNYDYGEVSGDWAYAFEGNSAISMPDDAEVVLPTLYKDKLFHNPTYSSGATNSALTIPTQEMVDTVNKNNVFGGTIGIILDRFDIQDSHHKLEAGNCTGVLGTSGGREIDGTEIGTQEIINVCSLKHYKEFLRVNDNSVNDYGTADFRSPADGAYIGFKLRLFYNTSSQHIGGGVLHRSTGSQIYKTVITPHHGDKTAWLKYVDLTGCYLVEESGTPTVSSVDSIIGTKVQPIYVYAQEVTNGSNDVELYTEVALTNGKAYRIMQPNPVCFYEESPDNIQLFVPRPEYTKKANSNEMYGKQKSHYFFDEGGNEGHETTNEAVLSMYAMIDVHNQTASTNIITTLSESVLPTGEHELFYSDGINSFKRNTSSKFVGENTHTLVIKDKKKLNGVISVSETFIVNSLEELKIEPNRACIGSTVTITNETEELVDELLKREDIDFNMTPENYPIYSSADFQGTNLFNTLNYLLHLKNKKIVSIEGQIKIINYNDADFNAQYSFTDDDITEIRTTKSNFNYFNEVIVYGKGHKAIRKDFKEIKKKGKKTLEIFEDKLTTKEDAEREAQEKLIMHTQLQELIECKIPVSKIKCLDVGETIILQSQVAGIEPRPFLILEKIQSFDGLVQLKLGKYIKGIEDTIADLLLDTKQTKSYLRNKSFNVNENAFDFFNSIKINEMHLLIRKKVVEAGVTLGFGTQLNTNTNTLGFGGGSTTYTTLKEEDL